MSELRVPTATPSDDDDTPPSRSRGRTTQQEDDIRDHAAFERYHFVGIKFPWSHLEAVGWTYHPDGTYRAPVVVHGTPGLLFASAKQVLEYLDSWAVPHVYTTLRWTKGNAKVDEEQASTEREVGTSLRTAVLERIFARNGKASSKESRFAEKAMSEGTAELPVGAAAEDTRARKVRRSSRESSSGRAGTVTAVEQGTDLYLHKRSRGSKSQKPKIQWNSSKRQERLSLAECEEFVQSSSMEEAERIEASYQDQFSGWRFLLSTNHSLLLYGAGSKRELINNFAKKELAREGSVLTIEGTDNKVSMTAILDLLVQVYLDGEEPADLSVVPHEGDTVPVVGKFCSWKTESTIERALMVGRGLAHKAHNTERECVPTPVFLVIHSLDTFLRTPATQQALAALIVNSTVSNGVASVRLVASVDHVDAPTLLWDPLTEANFAWVPCCVHTYRPYLEELATIEEQAQSKKTERTSRTTTQAKRILDVLRNLAPRHTEVVQLLAQLQSGSANEWVDYLKYRDRCKQACAINKDTQLRNLLTELKDHGLVVTKTEGSNELCQIPFSAEKLREIIEFDRGA
jgi:origin recognition complex subunit 2